MFPMNVKMGTHENQQTMKRPLALFLLIILTEAITAPAQVTRPHVRIEVDSTLYLAH